MKEEEEEEEDPLSAQELVDHEEIHKMALHDYNL
jgi:hypothetical protein